MDRSWSWPCRIQNEGEFLVENSGQDVLKGTPFWQRRNLKSTLEKRRTGAAIALEAKSAVGRSRISPDSIQNPVLLMAQHSFNAVPKKLLVTSITLILVS